MIAEGTRLPGGNATNLRWIVAPMETAPLDPSYGLVVAGSSVHWMDWPVVFPRFRGALAPGAYMAVVEERTSRQPWRGALQPVIDRYSTNRDYAPYDLISELRQRGHLRVVSAQETAPVPFVQSVAEYVESFHARNGFSCDRMTPEAAVAFDSEASEVVSAFCPNGVVRLEVSALVTWGLPLS